MRDPHAPGVAWWHYAPASKLPTPGAMEYGLTTNNQTFRPWIGPAIAPNFLWRMFAPQNYQYQAQAVLTGVGGLAHGQSVLQPLSNPYPEGM